MNFISNQRYIRSSLLIWLLVAGVMFFLGLLSPVVQGEDKTDGSSEVELPNGLFDEIDGFFVGGRVLVRLKKESSLPPGLSGTAALKEKRKNIAAVQKKFFDAMDIELDSNYFDETTSAKTKVVVKKGIKALKTIPYVAMDVRNRGMALKLANNPLVESVSFDEWTSPRLSKSIQIIGASSVRDEGYTGVGQAVAVLDTGVDKSHPALAGKVVKEACFSTFSSFYKARSLCPDGSEEQRGDSAGMACGGKISGCSHGTHVAGIVAANEDESSYRGVAPEADILAIQVFSRFAPESGFCGLSATRPCALSFTSDQVAALEQVLEWHEQGTTIAAVNMSLGVGKYSSYCDTGSKRPMKMVIDNLRAVGIATVAASGNERYKDGINSPACISTSISVGATTKSDSIAYFSNSAEILDLLAPGYAIISSMPGGLYQSQSGTSMAAPHVAGAWAVLKSAKSNASVGEVLDTLKETGVEIDTSSGFPKPRINLAEALKTLLDDDLTAEPDIEIKPTAYDFGDVEVDQSSTKRFTISNQGSGDLEIKALKVEKGGIEVGVLSLDPTIKFELTNDKCSNKTLTVGDSCTVKVNFKPTSKGLQTAVLVIPSNDPDTSIAHVELKGNGIVPVVLKPEIEINPSVLDFGEVNVNDASTQELTISNTGNADLNILTLNIGTGEFELFEDECSNQIVSAGDHCTVKVRFKPTSSGSQTSLLMIPSNDPDTQRLIVELKGNGVEPDIEISHPSYNFGEVELYQIAEQTFRVSNVGTSNLEVGFVTLADANYLIHNDDCSGQMIAMEQNCEVTVSFSPFFEGTHEAILSIPSNDPDNPFLDVDLMGQGIEEVVMSYTVLGHVRDAVGNPLIGATVSIAGQETITDEQGRFELKEFSEGEYTLIVTKAGFDFQPKKFTAGGDNPIIEVNVEANMVLETYISPALCQLYAVHDDKLNDSQFFTISLDNTFKINELGVIYEDYDIEAIAIHPRTNMIYAASGDDVAGGNRKGHFYQVDGKNGTLFPIGSTGFDEIEDLAFNADGSILWAWAKGDGLITIDLVTGVGQLEIPSDILVEGLTVNKENENILYGAIKTNLWVYNKEVGTLEIACTNLLGETEALEMIDGGFLLFGIDQDNSLKLHALEPTTCNIIAHAEIPITGFDFNDVEGIALPREACIKTIGIGM